MLRNRNNSRSGLSKVQRAFLWKAKNYAGWAKSKEDKLELRFSGMPDIETKKWLEYNNFQRVNDGKKRPEILYRKM